ncbi:sensor histidine kinase [Solirubrobacter phytolaccae]|uniref:histidine kinase n=1 Tax=Solirubrobacter phytolaccae TaxID=1404360 RepID=A0A9X3S829_9ACTN|nr:sensor histidine kinase [Solirubrobacter phytolaccae]MDA0179811.1 sensor histidine kinase [Solirubrobacter phytolaccae]
MTRERPTAGDVITTVLATAACIVVTLLVRGDVDDTRRDVDALAVALIVVGFAPTVLWRTRPMVPAIAALVLLLVGTAIGYMFVGPIVLAIALVGWAACRAESSTTWSLGLFAGVTFAVVMFVKSDLESVLAAIGGFAIGMVPALVGEQLRAERLRARTAQELARRVEELRDGDVQRAVAEERLRIARDVHDITGHHLSAIALQSAGAGRMTKDPGAREAFERIHGLTVEALGQTRRSLGVLRASEPAELAPPPRLEHLEQLLAPVRAAGLDVQLAIEGDVRALSETAEMSAYRVVQESVTNVIRHAGADAVRIAVVYGSAVVTITVADDGRGGPSARTGSGIEGMRERVALVGGSLTAGTTNGHGWTVRATLPLKDSA